jgi:hypothetical protein
VKCERIFSHGDRKNCTISGRANVTLTAFLPRKLGGFLRQDIVTQVSGVKFSPVKNYSKTAFSSRIYMALYLYFVKLLVLKYSVRRRWFPWFKLISEGSDAILSSD